jgi:hypothetical protein
MEPIGYHVMCRFKDRRVIAPTPEARRLVSRIILEKATGLRLLALNGADNHLHQELVEPRAVCGKLIHRIETSVRARLKIPVGWDDPEFKPIWNQGHLYHAFGYILDQEPRHGLARDPFHEATNLSDLLGLRVLGAYTANHVREYLPRINRVDLLRHLGVEALHEAAGPPSLVVPATLAASGLQDLTARDAEGRRARHAAMEVVGGQLPRARLAEMLGVDRRTLQRMNGSEADRRLVRAIKLQLGLRRLKTARAEGAFDYVG